MATQYNVALGVSDDYRDIGAPVGSSGYPDTQPVSAFTNPLTGGIDSLSAGGVIFNTTSIYAKLLSARQEAYNANPFDLQTVTSQPLVTSVTIPTSTVSLANPQTVTYFGTTGGYDAIRVDGVFYKDGTYGSGATVTAVGNISVVNTAGSFVTTNYSGTPGSGIFGLTGLVQNFITNFVLRARVVIGTANTNKCAIFTGVTNISSDYFPIWVNGIPVAPAVSAAVTNGLLQINFAAAGIYDIAIGVQQSLGVAGVAVDQDDTVISFSRQRLPILLVGDSYTMGTTRTPSNAQAKGDLTIASAMSWIGGINTITQGMSATGLVADGAAHLPVSYTSSSVNYGNTRRLQLITALANASNTPLIILQGSINDVQLAGNTSAIVQAQTSAILSYLLANTSANIIVTGAFPATSNLSAALTTIDTGALAAVTAAGTNRVAFLPVTSATPPWIVGGKTNAGTGTGAGNSRYYTGADTLHPSGLLTADQNIPANTVYSSGIEYIARKLLDGITRIAQSRNW
jgi:hypothetical protein